MHLRISIRRGIFFSLALLWLTSFTGQTMLYATEGPIKVVVLGSSTAEGANATPLSESWVNKFATQLGATNPGSQVVNLAVGGFTTFNVMPTGYVPPGSWNQPGFLPSNGHNITTALALAPDLIIVNLPTNDSDVLIPVDLQVANYATIVTLAAAQDIPVWITTSQPRNTTAAAQALIRMMVDATHEAFAGRSIDFWTGLGDAVGNILPQYDADGTHLNTAGHLVLFNRIVATVTYYRPAGPFVAMHPRARTVTEGDTVSFQVISYGSEAVSYQWQRNGADLPGETTAQLFLSNSAMTDSGAAFRCIITRGGDQAVSNDAVLTVHALPDPPSTVIVSDDFSADTLAAGVWTFRDPKQDATLSFTGTGTADAWLTIQVPGGTPHDLWTNGNEVPQILQPFANQNFELEVKFASTPTKKYQMQGLVVQKDSANLVRFDVVRQGTSAHLFAATFTDGAPTVRQDSTLGGAPPQFLRLRRAGDVWTGSYSYDGTVWKVVTIFSFSTVTTAGGIFAGNAGDIPSATPAFTAQIDYFFNAAAPIEPEDGPRAPALLAPVSGFSGSASDIILRWTSTGNAQDSVVVAADSLIGSSAAIATTVASDSASFPCTGLAPGATYSWRVRSSRDGVWSPWSATNQFTTTPTALTLRSTTTDMIPIFAPDTTWAASVSPHPGDWQYGQDKVIPVTIGVGDRFTLSSCSLTVHWDPARIVWKGIDVAGSLWAGATTTTVNADSITGAARIAALFPDTVTSTPGGAMVHVLFGMRNPGRSFITADQIRFSVTIGDASFQCVAIADTLIASVLLGDVASAGGITDRADGQVDFDDLSAWSLGYWSAHSDTGITAGRYRIKFDFGPTVDGTPFSLPLPDGQINFEDLMIMASTYGTTGSVPVPKSGSDASVTIEVHEGVATQTGDTTIIPVLLTGTAPDVHGLAFRLTGVSQSLIGVAPGDLLASITPAPLLFVRTVGEDAEVNIATIGASGRAIAPGGTLVTVRLRSHGTVSPVLMEARDGQNRTFVTTARTGGQDAAPLSYTLAQNFPNPFNPATTIRFAVADRQHTSLRIFDVLGRMVATLVDEVREPGTYALTWNASGFPSGMYLCRMVSGPFSATRRLMLVK